MLFLIGGSLITIVKNTHTFSYDAFMLEMENAETPLPNLWKDNILCNVIGRETKSETFADEIYVA